MKQRALRIVASLGLWLGSVADADSGRLYRYVDAQGHVELSHAVPADRVSQGYQVIDAATGQVLETVAPQLSPEALEKKQRRDREAELCRREMDRIHALYGNESDILRARDLAVASLDSRILQIQANLVLERRRLEDSEREAASRERAGRAVSAKLIDNMARMRAQIDTLEREMQQRRMEQEQAGARYMQDLELFRQDRCEAAEHRS